MKKAFIHCVCPSRSNIVFHQIIKVFEIETLLLCLDWLICNVYQWKFNRKKYTFALSANFFTFRFLVCFFFKGDISTIIYSNYFKFFLETFVYIRAVTRNVFFTLTSTSFLIHRINFFHQKDISFELRTRIWKNQNQTSRLVVKFLQLQDFDLSCTGFLDVVSPSGKTGFQNLRDRDFTD